MGRLLVGVAMCCGCTAHLGETADAAQIDAHVVDAPIVLGAWSAPTPIAGADDPVAGEDDCTLNAAATELIYAVQPTPDDNKDLYVMTRPTTAVQFGAPVALTVFNTAASEESPRLSPDDLTLYFGRDGDIYSSTRTVVGGTWSAPQVVASIDTGAYEKWLAVCNGGHVMVSRDNGATDQDLFEGTLADGANTADDVLNSVDTEISTFLSPDCLTVYFASNRSGQTQIYTSTRASIAGAWASPTIVGSPFSDGSDDEDPWISVDQRTFVFAAIRAPATTKDLYISTR